MEQKPGYQPAVSLHNDLAAIDAGEWDALGDDDHPFMDHAFLRSLELSGCVGERRPWSPRYLCLREGERLVGAAALYVRSDSMGEYIFDHAWADAYARAGLPYYPKGVVAAPFTPANGPRLLVDSQATPSEVTRYRELLAAKLVEECASLGISGVHALFHNADEAPAFAANGFLTRLSLQFHWRNNDYRDFADFLDDLRSSRRKQVRRERESVAASGLRIERLTGDAIEPDHMEAMYSFYMDTANRKWGRPYLNHAWFQQILDRQRERLLLVLAFDGPTPVAGTLNFYKGDAVYGRYWGALADLPALHFELCYYQLIEFAIEKKAERVEAGAQGEHKFLRGFGARLCWSSHWLADPGGREAISRFLKMERAQMERTLLAYNGQSPLKELRADARAELAALSGSMLHD